jgi:hypothetical protein
MEKQDEPSPTGASLPGGVASTGSTSFFICPRDATYQSIGSVPPNHHLQDSMEPEFWPANSPYYCQERI